MKLTPHEIAFVAAQAGFVGDDLVIAVAVGMAESSEGDTEARHRSTADVTNPAFGQWDHGVWEISGYWHGKKLQQHPNWRDPYENAVLAKEVFEERKATGHNGWTAWAVYNSRAHEKYLPDARIGVKSPFPPVTFAEAVAAELADRWKE